MAGLPFGGKDESKVVDESESVVTPQEEKRSKRSEKRNSNPQGKYGVFDPNDLKKGRGIAGFLSTGGGKLTILSLIFAFIAGAGVYVYTADSSATVQQLVINKDIAANTLVTTADVVPVDVPADSVQDSTLLVTMGNISSGTAYTKVALKRNTVLTLGSIGPYTRLANELPEGMQLLSITVAPENAAGGSVAAGDLVNIFGKSDDSPILATGMKNVRVVDVIVSPKSIAAGANSDPAGEGPSIGSDSPDLKSGIGSVYKLAVTPEQAAQLARAVVGGATFYLVLTNEVDNTVVEPEPVATLPSTELPNPINDAFGAAQDIINGGPKDDNFQVPSDVTSTTGQSQTPSVNPQTR